MRECVQDGWLQLQMRQVRFDPGAVVRPRHVWTGEIVERAADAADRVEHAHRALHDVGQVTPAGAGEAVRRHGVEVLGATAEIVADGAADDGERGTDGTGERLDQAGLAGAGFAGEAVDLVAADLERDVVHRADLARDAKRLHPVVGAQVADGEQRRHGGLPSRARRLRGSIYSFIEMASRNRPTNRATTEATGKAIHHQMPETSAVCWLAQ